MAMVGVDSGSLQGGLTA